MVAIQREAQNPSPVGEGRVRGNQKMLNAWLILLSPSPLGEGATSQQFAVFWIRSIVTVNVKCAVSTLSLPVLRALTINK
jgi:hypothetical protein